MPDVTDLKVFDSESLTAVGTELCNLEIMIERSIKRRDAILEVLTQRQGQIEDILKNRSNDIASLALTPRFTECLRKSGIKTIAQLCDRTSEHILKISETGAACVEEIEEALARRNLSLTKTNGKKNLP